MTESSPATAEPPADLIRAYRQLAVHRQGDWHDSSDSYVGIRVAAAAIRAHPYWRTLPDPAAVAAAAKTLRRLSVLPEDGAERILPFPPPETDPQLHQQPAPGARTTWPRLAKALDEAGLWDDLTEAERAAERRYVEATGIGLRHELFYRELEFFADGEELAEQGVSSFLDLLAPSLAAFGLALDVVAVHDPYHAPGAEEYVLDINGVRCVVWSKQEADESAYLWYQATIRPLIVINELLAGIGSAARLYVAGVGGNDGFVYVLSHAVRAALVAGATWYDFADEYRLATRAHWDLPAPQVT